mmetsp:Transcript_31422/g.101593  ORF Transcript_31422/g.101593 Transcript_31422/m.101593 type:complete len:254 (+) Transcript_31422:1267-2028(+)|eukprot:scaffold1397_cov122-Isochrysis_galbana.AAC.7
MAAPRPPRTCGPGVRLSPCASGPAPSSDSGTPPTQIGRAAYSWRLHRGRAGTSPCREEPAVASLVVHHNHGRCPCASREASQRRRRCRAALQVDAPAPRAAWGTGYSRSLLPGRRGCRRRSRGCVACMARRSSHSHHASSGSGRPRRASTPRCGRGYLAGTRRVSPLPRTEGRPARATWMHSSRTSACSAPRQRRRVGYQGTGRDGQRAGGPGASPSPTAGSFPRPYWCTPIPRLVWRSFSARPARRPFSRPG